MPIGETLTKADFSLPSIGNLLTLASKEILWFLYSLFLFRSSLHPDGACGLFLDTIGLILLLGSISLIGFEYYWRDVLAIDFNLAND